MAGKEESRITSQKKADTIPFHTFLLQIAFKRYTDNVRSAFYTIFLQPILDDTFETLASELGIYEENAMRNAKMYLQEDMNIIQRRNDLLAKEQTLSSASQVINAFWTDSLRVDA